MLQTHLESGRLIELPSLFTGTETARRMIVTPDIFAAVEPEFSDDARGERLAEFRQWLDAFSEHCELSVAERPQGKPSDAMMARVDPVNAEFWSIRVTAPEDTPGIRSFGAFADKDAFIALTWDFRESIVDFDDDVSSTRQVWRDLFEGVPPHSGDNLDDYLTNFHPV